MSDTDTTLDWQALIDDHVATRTHRESAGRDRHVPDVDLPLSEVNTYRSVSITEVELGDVRVEDIRGPVDLLGIERDADDVGPAVGVILEFQQAWRMKGLAIGRLLHSLCLAPGEVTQIAMVDWRRETRAGTSRTIGERESASSAAERSRDTHRVSEGVAHDTTSGFSSASSLSRHSEGGASFLGIGGGASGNSSVATQVNFNFGSRGASADSFESVREATDRHVANARTREATLVQEISESETEQFTTRVVANYNHMHSLNMQYYEVLQVYELQSRPVGAERCLFLPMEIMTFDGENVIAFAKPLADAARAMGRPALAAGIAGLDERLAGLRERQTELEALKPIREREVVAARTELGARIAASDAALTEEQSLETTFEAAVKRNNDAVAELEALRPQIDGMRSNIAAMSVDPLGLLAAATEPLRRQLRESLAREAQLRSTVRDAQAEIGRINRWRGEELPRIRAAVEVARRALAARQRALGEIEIELVQSSLGAVFQTHELIDALNEEKLAFNQAIWLAMTPSTVAAMLDGREYRGSSLIEHVDPTPVAIVGNRLGFRWSFPDDEFGAAEAKAFEARHLDDYAEPVIDTRVLPTGGVFAEAVLGRANAAEKLDMTRFWNWDEDTIPILPTAIDKLRSTRRARRGEARPGTLGAPSVEAGALPDAPPGPGDLADVLGASLFRDMSGAGAVTALLEEGQKQAAAGSRHAMQVTHENIKAYLDHLEVVLPEVAGLVGPGKLNPSKLGALGNALGGAGGAGGAKGGPLKPDALVKLAGKAGLLG